MSNLPIACTLSAADLTEAKARYRAAADRYQATAHIDGNHARISLIGDTAALNDILADMIDRESACCPFLVFDTTEHTDGLDVQLSIRDDSGLEPGILRESIETFFPTARIV